MERWNTLFQADLRSCLPIRNAFNAGKSVLITGAGGYIGSALAKAIAGADPRLLILVDHSVENLDRVRSNLESVPQAAICGNITNQNLLTEVFEKYRPDTIYHAAAQKHVPQGEQDPLSTIENNVFGTEMLARTAIAFATPQLTMISTDKAVRPSSIMGASKRVAELVILSLAGATTGMNAVRLGNVFGSSGSVVPRFAEQIANGGPLTVTHPEARRFFMTLPEALEIIFATAAIGDSGLFIPELGEPLQILDLARRMAGGDTRLSDIIFTGLRPGEKVSEETLSAGEFTTPTKDRLLFRVNGRHVAPGALDSALKDLSTAVEAHDLARVLEALLRLVPEYVPSESLSALAALGGVTTP